MGRICGGSDQVGHQEVPLDAALGLRVEDHEGKGEPGDVTNLHQKGQECTQSLAGPGTSTREVQKAHCALKDGQQGIGAQPGGQKVLP